MQNFLIIPGERNCCKQHPGKRVSCEARREREREREREKQKQERKVNV